MPLTTRNLREREHHIVDGVGAPEAEVYRSGEKAADVPIISHQELLKISIAEDNTSFVSGNTFSKQVLLGDEALNSGKDPGEPRDIIWLVREEVATKLALAAGYIWAKKPWLCLKLCEGYRPMNIQQERFDEKIKFLKSGNRTFSSNEELQEAAHQLTAIPELAGHPTGGAVDVTIFDTKLCKNLDMGTVIYDFSDPIKLSWEAKNLLAEQKSNRLLLLDAMLQAGFAPYWGEWWHYSFGEIEWAAYYKYKKTFYSQLSVTEVLARRKS